MFKIKNFLVFLLFLVSASLCQENNQAKSNIWKCYLNNDTIIDSISLNKRLSTFLIISKGDSTYQISISKVKIIRRYIAVKDDNTDITGVFLGTLLGGAIGFLVAPKITIWPGGTYLHLTEKNILLAV